MKPYNNNSKTISKILLENRKPKENRENLKKQIIKDYDTFITKTKEKLIIEEFLLNLKNKKRKNYLLK